MHAAVDILGRDGLRNAALRIDGPVRIAVSKLAFRVAHGLASATELVHLALPLLRTLLAEALLAQLLHQLVELIA